MEQRNRREIEKIEMEIWKIIDIADRHTPKEFLEGELCIWKDRTEEMIAKIKEENDIQEEIIIELNNLLKEEKNKLKEYLEGMIRKSIFVIDVEKIIMDEENYNINSLLYERLLEEKLDKINNYVEDREKLVVLYQKILKKFERQTGTLARLQILEDNCGNEQVDNELEDDCENKQVDNELKSLKNKLNRLVKLILGRGLDSFSDVKGKGTTYKFSLNTRKFFMELLEESKNPNIKKISSGKYLEIDKEFRFKIATWLEEIQQDKYFKNMKISKTEIDERINKVFCIDYCEVFEEIECIKNEVEFMFNTKDYGDNGNKIMQLKQTICDCSDEIMRLGNKMDWLDEKYKPLIYNIKKKM